jgi:S1-C subfamily serine protease
VRSVFAYRTTTPMEGLSPATDRSRFVALFGDTPLILDILNHGAKDNDIHGRGSWGAGEEHDPHFRESGEDYMREVEDSTTRMLKRLRMRSPSRREIWVAIDNRGKRYEFPTYEAAKMEMDMRGLRPKRITRKFAQRIESNPVSRTLDACVQVRSRAKNGAMEVGAGFGIGNNRILTCAHVLKRYDKMKLPASLESEIGLVHVLHKGHAAEATVEGISWEMDLAVISSRLPLGELRLGSSRALEPGAAVVAVGSPQGFENNVSAGILSSRDRKIFPYPHAPLYLFTDAQILPGSSGGPLVSMADGTVVGMICLIVGGKNFYGLNAALPVEYIRRFLRENHVSRKE